MSPTANALLGVAVLHIVLAIVLVSVRGLLVVGRGRAVNEFRPDGAGDPPFVQRLTRAHANLYENVATWGVVLLLAISSGRTHISDPFARVLFGLRVAQTSIHLLSTSALAV